MGERDAVGIDPDSKALVCAHVQVAQRKVTTRRYMISDSDLRALVQWLKAQGDLIVAIEGSGGVCRPIEKALREAGIVFYSCKPADTQNFRKAVLGENKDNQKDAEAVARYAISMDGQGRLERYRRVWPADAELQLLSRTYHRITRERTEEVNRLWKLLRLASPDLYLLLAGEHPQADVQNNVLQGQGILTLLSGEPDVGRWKTLSAQQILQLMGGGKYKGREKLIRELQKLACSFPSLSAAMAVLIGNSAEQILRLKAQGKQIVGIMEELTQDSRSVAALKAIRGISTITAVRMHSEIIHIRRFAAEDSLARYSGFGMTEHSSGSTIREKPSHLFNHRLKDAFMNAARNFVLYNPDSHLSGYYRNLLKRGMSSQEATKRVARALVRVIYRKLRAISEREADLLEQQKKGEGGMASGSLRSDHSHESNIPPSSQSTTTVQRTEKVKTLSTERRRAANARRNRRKAITKKRA